MLSYSWANKVTVLKIREGLTQRNLKVWFDDENMSGSIYKKMAEGVRTSSVFVPCLSADYSHSTNCLNEIGFAVKEKKIIVPVRLDDNITDELNVMTSRRFCEYILRENHAGYGGVIFGPGIYSGINIGALCVCRIT